MSEKEMLPAVRTEGELAPAQPGAAPEVMAVVEVERQMKAVHGLMAKVMVQGVDYDIIPGTKKPSLLQPGAEKLGVMFRIAPIYEVTKTELPNGHREYQSYCRLTNITTGQFLGEAYGLCSTMETRYRYRQGERTCPQCGEAAIIKGKVRYSGGVAGYEKGGWLCFKKKGGCGAKWPDGDRVIEGQKVGREENPDIADCYHTSLAISQKRSYVRAIRNATAASAIFTDSTEDLEQGPPPPREPDRQPDRGPDRPPTNRQTQEADDYVDQFLGGKGAPPPQVRSLEDQRADLGARLKELGYNMRSDIDKLARENKIEKRIEDWTLTDIHALAKVADSIERREKQAIEDEQRGR